MARQGEWLQGQPWPGSPLDPENGIARGLVACWICNAGSGPSLANVAGQTSGTLTGSPVPAWSGSQIGTALLFDGSQNYVSGPVPAGLLDFIPSTGIFTIAARAKLTNYNADAAGGILAGSGGTADTDFAFWYENRSAVSSPRQFKFSIGVGTSGTYGWSGQTATGIVADNNWHTAAFSVANTSFAGYVDGQPSSGTFAQSGSTSPALTVLPDIGRFSANYLYFGGLIDIISVWNRPLSATEVRSWHEDPAQVFAKSPFYAQLIRRRTMMLYDDEDAPEYS